MCSDLFLCFANKAGSGPPLERGLHKRRDVQTYAAALDQMAKDPLTLRVTTPTQGLGNQGFSSRALIGLCKSSDVGSFHGFHGVAEDATRAPIRSSLRVLIGFSEWGCEKADFL